MHKILAQIMDRKIIVSMIQSMKSNKFDKRITFKFHKYFKIIVTSRQTLNLRIYEKEIPHISNWND